MTATLEMETEMENNGFEESVGFTINDSGSAFKLLSSGLYSRPIHAIIREYSTNALDSHIAAQNNDPFDVHLPTVDEPTFWIRDYGTGASRKEVAEIWTDYFNSTKTNDSSTIGRFGLGSKSALAYVNSFGVVSYYAGERTRYIMQFNSDDKPELLTEASPEPTDQPNGIKIQFSVDVADFDQFYDAAKDVYRYFNRQPNFVNCACGIEKPQYALSAEHGRKYNWGVKRVPWTFRHSRTFLESNVVMGCIAYPLPGAFDAYCTDIYADIDTFDITPSREALRFTPETKEKLKSIFRGIEKKVVEALFARVEVETTFWGKMRVLDSVARVPKYEDAITKDPRYQALEKELSEWGKGRKFTAELDGTIQMVVEKNPAGNSVYYKDRYSWVAIDPRSERWCWWHNVEFEKFFDRKIYVVPHRNGLRVSDVDEWRSQLANSSRSCVFVVKRYFDEFVEYLRDLGAEFETAVISPAKKARSNTGKHSKRAFPGCYKLCLPLPKNYRYAEMNKAWLTADDESRQVDCLVKIDNTTHKLLGNYGYRDSNLSSRGQNLLRGLEVLYGGNVHRALFVTERYAEKYNYIPDVVQQAEKYIQTYKWKKTLALVHLLKYKYRIDDIIHTYQGVYTPGRNSKYLKFRHEKLLDHPIFGRLMPEKCGVKDSLRGWLNNVLSVSEMLDIFTDNDLNLAAQWLGGAWTRTDGQLRGFLKEHPYLFYPQYSVHEYALGLPVRILDLPGKDINVLKEFCNVMEDKDE